MPILLGRLQSKIELDVTPGRGSRWYHFFPKSRSIGTELTSVLDNGKLQTLY
jgi:hypothetical protein